VDRCAGPSRLGVDTVASDFYRQCHRVHHCPHRYFQCSAIPLYAQVTVYRTGSRAVMRPDSFVDSCAMLIVYLLTLFPNLLTLFLSPTCLLPYFATSLRVGPLRFQAGDRKRRPNLTLVFLCLFYVVVYFVTDACCFCCVFFRY